MPGADQLLAAFGSLAGRPRQVLVSRLLESRSREVLAAFYGVELGAADVLFFRAVGELDWALSHPPHRPPRPDPVQDVEERATAAALGSALATGGEGSPSLLRRLELCRSVIEHAPALRPALILPPAPALSRRERIWDVSKRLAWLVLVIAAAVLYSRWTAR